MSASTHFGLAAALLGLSLAPAEALRTATAPLPHAARVLRARIPIAAASAGESFSADAWAATDWDDSNDFERYTLLRKMLDGGMGPHEVNHAAWRGLGYSCGPEGALLAPDGTACTSPPDVLSDATTLAHLEAQLPHEDSSEFWDEELEQLGTLIDTLHGAELTRLLVEEADADFLARRTVVMWLYMTQPSLALAS